MSDKKDRSSAAAVEVVRECRQPEYRYQDYRAGWGELSAAKATSSTKQYAGLQNLR